jgi:hypothetical protein
MSLHWHIRNAESAIREAVRNCFPTDWREEFIVRTLLKKFRDDLGSLSITSQSHTVKVDWSVYQNHGVQEQTFGDIGLLVRFNFKDGRTVEGVAYIEAKKRSRGKDTFDELRVAQLRTIVKNAPRAHLLLLDYSGIANFAAPPNTSTWLEEYFDEPSPYQRAFITYAATLPINTALALGVKDTRLYESTAPISFQLLQRYLYGLDLEFDARCVDAAKGFADKLGAPRYLLVVNVVQVGAPATPELRLNNNRLGPARDL